MFSTKIPAPKIEDRVIIKPLHCGPGPCDISPEVQKSLSMPIISPICDEYYNVVRDIRHGLQYLFQTQSKLVLAISGSGHAGMEAVISNIVAPKETLLIASRGMWDERAFILAKRYGINAVVTKVPIHSTFTLQQLEAALKIHKPVALFITHGDSSTGTVQNLEGVGDLCHKYGALLLVDTVVSIGGVPFYMDEWKVDCVYGSTQKALSGPAGIAQIAFSALAEKKINTRSHQPPFYFDVKLLALQWRCNEDKLSYHHTLSPPLLWALRCCLKEVSKETLPARWERHIKSTAHFHKRLQELGFKFFIPKPEDRLALVTTVTLPDGYDYVEFTQYMRKKHNISIFPGLGPSAGKTLRIGIMGINSTTQVAEAIANAMADTLKDLTRASL